MCVIALVRDEYLFLVCLSVASSVSDFVCFSILAMSCDDSAFRQLWARHCAEEANASWSQGDDLSEVFVFSLLTREQVEDRDAERARLRVRRDVARPSRTASSLRPSRLGPRPSSGSAAVPDLLEAVRVESAVAGTLREVPALSLRPSSSLADPRPRPTSSRVSVLSPSTEPGRLESRPSRASHLDVPEEPLVVEVVESSSDSEPSPPLGPPGSLDSSRNRLDVAVERLVRDLRAAYSPPNERPYFMEDSTDDVLRRAASSYGTSRTLSRSLGPATDRDWGNNAGSVLFLLACFKGFDLFSQRDSMLVQGQGFATSGIGPCNRRCNYWEALLKSWHGDSTRSQLRLLLLECWRLTAIAMSIVWTSDIVTNHDYVHSARGNLLFSASPDLFPCGDFSDFEVDFFQTLHCTEVPSADGQFVVDRVPFLPDVGSHYSKADIAGVSGFSKDSQTVKKLYSAICQCEEEGRPHRGQTLRLAFACNRALPL